MTEPHPPPPDQPHEPPPDQPYEPPPDQPYEPPPDQPHEAENLRRSRRGWIIPAAGILVVAVGAATTTVAFILAPTGGTASSSDPDRYGQKVVDVVQELHIACDHPEVDDKTAFCDFPDGNFTMVATAENKADMDDLVDWVKGLPGSPCTVVVKGYLVAAPDRGSLTHVVGNPEAFAATHHGYLVGNCS